MGNSDGERMKPPFRFFELLLSSALSQCAGCHPSAKAQIESTGMVGHGRGVAPSCEIPAKQTMYLAE